MPGDFALGDTTDSVLGLAHPDSGESAGENTHRVIAYGARAYQQRVQQVGSGRPEIVTVEADLDTIETQVVQCAELAAKERSVARSKRIRTPTTEALAAAKARRVRRHRLGDLGLVDAESGPCTGSRGLSRIRHSTSDYIAVLILRRGSEQVTQDGERALLGAGDVLICDTQRALSFDMTTSAHKQILLVPRGAIEEITGRAWPARAMLLRPDSPATALLANHLDGLIRTSTSPSPDCLTELPADAALAARTATLYLVAGAAVPAGTELTADSAPELLREAMKRWIETHLLEPNLCPAAVADAHAVSLRTDVRR